MLSRRTMMQIAAAALLVPAAGASATLPARRRPRRLRRGDTVGLIEPAGFTNDAFDLALVLETIRAMGLVPRPAPHLLSRYGYLAGRDEERAADVNAMFADPEVRAIFAVRGGWGCARVLPHLDFDLIRANPKLLTGFSDITALHLALAARTDCPTIHGPNAASAWGTLSWNSFRRLAFDAETPTWTTPVGTEDRLAQRSGRIRTFRPGRATGPLLGGNLTVLSALVGTPYLPSFDGAILFLEDTDEAQYRIDRMLTQLALAGILGRVA
ncbi:MAG: LD-carboxypeptidase, partial [Sphingomonas sp.]